jgi:hypothetical protein
MRLSAETLDVVLTALGELLTADGEAVRLIAVGGAVMSLLGFVERTTSDLDVIARTEGGGSTAVPIPPDPLPEALRRAAATVARDFNLLPDWLNTEIAAQWRTGLPPGLAGDITWHHYGGSAKAPESGLHLGLVGRSTLITLKLFAAVDQGPRSVHFQDLLALRPTAGELEAAAAWVRTQDEGPEFAALVGQVVERVLRDSHSDGLR